MDRLIASSGDRIAERLADSLRTALDISEGIVVVDVFEEDQQKDSLLFSEKFACPVSGFSLGEIEPRLFSFNAPTGACEACDGLGREEMFAALGVTPKPVGGVARHHQQQNPELGSGEAQRVLDQEALW